jgi:hypothetical protein
MQVFFYESKSLSYCGIIVLPRAPLATSFPVDEIISLYAGYEIEVASFPGYVVASELGGFEKKEVKRGLAFYIYGSTAAELEAFVTGLGSGWVLDPSQGEDGENVYMYGETKARLVTYDATDEKGMHCIFVQFDVLKSEWDED